MTLEEALLGYGLLEMGVFQTEAGRVPYRLRLDLLPAYPVLLADCAEKVAAGLMKVDRLVCPADSFPIGIAVGLHTRIPLIYSRGRGEGVVQDWVGAYDVGHPAALICNVMPNAETLALWQKQVTSVGLRLVQVMALVQLRPLTGEVTGQALVDFPAWVRRTRQIPDGAAKAILGTL